MVSKVEMAPGCVKRGRLPRLLVTALCAGLLSAASPAVWASNVTYSYNANGQIVKATYDNGIVVNYSYDANGNRTAALVDTPALETPTDLSATSSATEIDLAWTGSSGASGYYIWRCTGSNCTNFTQVGAANSTTYSDTGLAGLTTYVYQVQAYQTSGSTTITSAMSTPASATTGATPPTAPGNLAASASGTSISLTWMASTDDIGVAGYDVQRCQGAGCGNFTALTTVTTTGYTDSGLAQGATYQYRVLAFNTSSQQSGWSNTASATIPITTPPTVPTGLTATADSWSTVSLSWNASADSIDGVAGYKVYRNGGLLGTAGGTTYTDSTTAPNTTYSYTVSAYDPAGNNSAQSSPASASTPPAPVPSTPTGLSGSPASDTSITLTWNAASDSGGPGIAGYRIYRNGIQVGTTSGTSYTDTGLTTFSSYSYTVAAYDTYQALSSQTASIYVTVGYHITNSTQQIFAPGYSISQGEVPYSPQEYYWYVYAPNGDEVAEAQTGANGYEPACYGSQGGYSEAASGYQLNGCDLWAAPSTYGR